MTRKWFAQPLETVATYWRVLRTDGVTLGFTSHDADLWFDGIAHKASPGMMPAAIRRTTGLDADSAEISGALTDDSIAEDDLIKGRFDGASVVVGLVDWQSLETQPIYSGSIGTISQESDSFTAQLQSRKAELQRDPVPRTSPACRADFCGKGCGLSAARFEHEGVLASQDLTNNLVSMTVATTNDAFIGGTIRWIDGPYAGIVMGITGLHSGALVLDTPMDWAIPVGAHAIMREGCDHTLATCASRFGNAVNFQGEPFLPGNDLVIRYGLAS